MIFLWRNLKHFSIFFFLAASLCLLLTRSGASSDSLWSYREGVNVQADKFLPGFDSQPTGMAFVNLLQANHVGVVRIWARCPLLARLMGGGWRTVFDELNQAGIKVILDVGEGVVVRSVPRGSQDKPVTWDSDFDAFDNHSGEIVNVDSYIRDAEALLEAIRKQYGGKYPENFAAIDVCNEPLITDQNLSNWQRVIAAIRTAAPGIPVTIGGWRVRWPARKAGVTRQRWNWPWTPSQEPNPLVREIAAMEDFVSVHIYPDNMTPDKTTEDFNTYVPFVRQYLDAALSESGGKPVFVEEFGGKNGLAEAGATHSMIGSPLHQIAAIQAVLTVMRQDRTRGMIGGTIWGASPFDYELCGGWALICFQPHYVSPALHLIESNL